MIETAISTEPYLRLAVFAALFVLLALFERLAPRRAPGLPPARRWPHNIAVAVVNTTLLRVLLPASMVTLAAEWSARDGALLNQVVWPGWVEVLLAVLLLDLVIYWQHRLFHAIPVLWRLHRMHHADTDFDVTTGVRFHPLEIALSLLIKLGAVFLLGTPAIAVLIFELVLSSTSLFNHANLRLPPACERLLRAVVVTPDMHRVHHSVEADEHNRNFGFNLPWWDHLFGSYRASPRGGHDGMVIGLPVFRAPRELALHRLLLQPFRRGDAAPDP